MSKGIQYFIEEEYIPLKKVVIVEQEVNTIVQGGIRNLDDYSD